MNYQFRFLRYVVTKKKEKKVAYSHERNNEDVWQTYFADEGLDITWFLMPCPSCDAISVFFFAPYCFFLYHFKLISLILWVCPVLT